MIIFGGQIQQPGTIWIFNSVHQKILEEIQASVYRKLLDVPKSCPSPSLIWDFGSKLMKYRIMERKLNFLHHLLNLSPESLAHQILKIQIENQSEGLVSEADK